MTCSKQWALLLLGSFILGPCRGAAAEDDYLDYSLDQLMGMEISSASKRPETIADIPASVTIITRRDLERMGYPNLDEVLRNVPGLYLLDNYEDQLIGVRGGIGGGIQFLVNGVPRQPTRIKGLSVPDRSRFNIPVQSIDRIEVIRGPMSVIYGENAFLGSINIITNEAAATPNLGSLSYGDNGARQAFLRLRREFDDGFAVLNGGWDTDNGVDGRYRDLMDADQLAGLDPRMHDKLDGDLDHSNYSLDLSAALRSFTLDVQYSRMNYGAYFLTPPFDDGNRINLTTFTTALGHELIIAKGLRLATSLVYSAEEYRADLDFVVPDLGSRQKQKSNRLDLEAVLNWSANRRLDLLAGYRHRRLSGIRNNARINALDIVVDQDSNNVNQDDLYAQAVLRPIDQVKLVAGLRGSHTGAYRVTRASPQPAARFPARTTWTPRAGLIWDIDEHHLLKLLYGEADQHNNEAQISEPENIATLELNYLGHYEHGSLQLSLFQNRTDHLLRKTQFFNPVTGLYEKRLNNSGRLRTRGIELIAQLQPLRGLDWSFSATWQESKDLENPDIAVGNSPHWLAKSKLSYRRAAWTGGLSLHYVGGMKTDWQWVTSARPGLRERIGDSVDDYLLVDANLRYDFPGRGPYANLHIGNLFDKTVRYPANELVNFRNGAPGPGRSVLLLLGWKF